MGERQAQKVVCLDYDKPRFQAALNKIRTLTPEEPEIVIPSMKKLCADAGVCLALVPEMKKVPWNGATKWITPRKAMILLNLRGKGEDKFWFSFFHEAGHVLYDKKRDLLINDGSTEDPREQRADEFASEFLIPKKWDDTIRISRSAADLHRIARNLEISVGIVAGRYQHLTKKWNYHKKLIRTLKWSNRD